MTLADAVREQPPSRGEHGQPNDAYAELASLVRYEHMQVSSNDPQFAEAMEALEADDAKREKADFTLTDLQGKSWHLRDLKGEVILVNFWATWCPPCRKEMPDLQALYDKYKSQGFVVLSISDEEAQGIALHFRAPDHISGAARSGTQGQRGFCGRGDSEELRVRSPGKTGGTVHRYADAWAVPADACCGRVTVIA
jgi:thiol-disulfide isomerase/thioredoxin